MEGPYYHGIQNGNGPSYLVTHNHDEYGHLNGFECEAILYQTMDEAGGEAFKNTVIKDSQNDDFGAPLPVGTKSITL